MRGFVGNELAAIADENIPGIWQAVMARFSAIPEYPVLFEAAYPGTPFDQMTLAHASNAMAGFFVDQLTFNDTPWDRFLAGNDNALTEEQLEGARTFLSDGRCVTCHRGPGLSDEQFHNTALAQFGPGQGDGPAGNDDHGRYRITGETHLLYAYRTPPLRNVELTAPYGHVGQFRVLRDFVSHYSRSDDKLRNYDVGQVDPIHQGTMLGNFNEILETRDPLLDGLELSEVEIDQLVEFLNALTDDRARNLEGIVPARVPSGLPIDR
jgi:cytochrome c peroxidase